MGKLYSDNCWMPQCTSGLRLVLGVNIYQLLVPAVRESTERQKHPSLCTVHRYKYSGLTEVTLTDLCKQLNCFGENLPRWGSGTSCKSGWSPFLIEIFGSDEFERTSHEKKYHHLSLAGGVQGVCSISLIFAKKINWIVLK